MKKFVLSLFVVLTFTLYSFQQSNESAQVRVLPPATIPSPTQDSQTPTTSTDAPTTGPTNQPIATPTTQSMMQNRPMMRQGQYKDGTYTGDAADAFYGNIQVQAVIANGKISDVLFLQYPNDRSTSIEINTQAMPYLKQEAIQAQNEKVDIVSGATDSSIAFIQSLGSALAQAH